MPAVGRAPDRSSQPWGAFMSLYRLYFMNIRNGHIEQSIDFDAIDDDAAITKTWIHEGPQPLELWDGARKVRRFEPEHAVRVLRVGLRSN